MRTDKSRAKFLPQRSCKKSCKKSHINEGGYGNCYGEWEMDDADKKKYPDSASVDKLFKRILGSEISDWEIYGDYELGSWEINDDVYINFIWCDAEEDYAHYDCEVTQGIADKLAKHVTGFVDVIPQELYD